MLHQALFCFFLAMCIFCKIYFNIYFSFLGVKTTTTKIHPDDTEGKPLTKTHISNIINLALKG